MKNTLPVGTVVSYQCPILGAVNGPIQEYKNCVGNGRLHVVIGIDNEPDVTLVVPFSEVSEGAHV